MNDRDLKDILQRIEKLEKVVLAGSKGRASKKLLTEKESEEKFTGPTGGIRLLATKGFFTAKRGLADVKNELEKNGYHYSIQAVQVGLSRLSKPGGPLVSIREDKRKKYAKRK